MSALKMGLASCHEKLVKAAIIPEEQRKLYLGGGRSLKP
jgi:hypothetical protein